jgi:hypothetical protein
MSINWLFLTRSMVTVKGLSEICSAYEIERRPRGASQHKAAPTSVSGQ